MKQIFKKSRILLVALLSIFMLLGCVISLPISMTRADEVQAVSSDWYQLSYTHDSIDFKLSGNFRNYLKAGKADLSGLKSSLSAALKQIAIQGVLKSVDQDKDANGLSISSVAPIGNIWDDFEPGDGIHWGDIDNETLLSFKAYVEDRLSDPTELQAYLDGDYDLLLEYAIGEYIESQGDGELSEHLEKIEKAIQEVVESAIENALDRAAETVVRREAEKKGETLTDEQLEERKKAWKEDEGQTQKSAWQQQSKDRLDEVAKSIEDNGGKAPSISLNDFVKAFKGLYVNGHEIYDRNNGFDNSGFRYLLSLIPTPAQIEKMNAEQLSKLFSAKITINTTYAEIKFDFTFGFFGESTAIQKAAGLIAQYFDASLTEDTLTVNANMPEAFAQAFLAFTKSGKISDVAKQKVFDLFGKTTGEVFDEELGYTYEEFLEYLKGVDFQKWFDNFLNADFINTYFGNFLGTLLDRELTSNDIDNIINKLAAKASDYLDRDWTRENALSFLKNNVPGFGTIKGKIGEERFNNAIDKLVKILNRVNWSNFNIEYIRETINKSNFNDRVVSYIEQFGDLGNVYDTFIEYVEKLIGYLPQDLLDSSVLDLYQGDQNYNFKGVVDFDSEKIVGRIADMLSKYGFGSYGDALKELATAIEQKEYTLNIDFNLYIPNVYKVEYVVGDADNHESLRKGLLPVGADTDFFDYADDIEGHKILYWVDENKNKITEMPNKDIVLYAVTDFEVKGFIDEEEIIAIDTTYEYNKIYELSVEANGVSYAKDTRYSYVWYKGEGDNKKALENDGKTYDVTLVKDSGVYTVEVTDNVSGLKKEFKQFTVKIDRATVSFDITWSVDGVAIETGEEVDLLFDTKDHFIDAVADITSPDNYPMGLLVVDKDQKSDFTGRNVKEYEAKINISLSDTENYQFADDSKTEATLEWKISPLEVTVSATLDGVGSDFWLDENNNRITYLFNGKEREVIWNVTYSALNDTNGIWKDLLSDLFDEDREQGTNKYTNAKSDIGAKIVVTLNSIYNGNVMVYLAGQEDALTENENGAIKAEFNEEWAIEALKVKVKATLGVKDGVTDYTFDDDGKITYLYSGEERKVVWSVEYTALNDQNGIWKNLYDLFDESEQSGTTNIGAKTGITAKIIVKLISEMQGNVLIYIDDSEEPIEENKIEAVDTWNIDVLKVKVVDASLKGEGNYQDKDGIITYTFNNETQNVIWDYKFETLNDEFNFWTDTKLNDIVASIFDIDTENTSAKDVDPEILAKLIVALKNSDSDNKNVILWVDGEEQSRVEFTEQWAIDPLALNLSVTWNNDITQLTYTGNEQEVNVTSIEAIDAPAFVTKELFDLTRITYTDNKKTVCNTYTAYADLTDILNGNNNYTFEPKESEFKWAIVPATVPAPANKWKDAEERDDVYTYTFELNEFDVNNVKYIGLDELEAQYKELYTPGEYKFYRQDNTEVVDINELKTTRGAYFVRITLTLDSNYVISGTGATTITFEAKIIISTIDLDFTGATWYFDGKIYDNDTNVIRFNGTEANPAGSAQAPVVGGLAADKQEYIDYCIHYEYYDEHQNKLNGKPTNAGIYYIKAVANDGYVIKNSNITDLRLFEIKKLVVTPSVTVGDVSFDQTKGVYYVTPVVSSSVFYSAAQVGDTESSTNGTVELRYLFTLVEAHSNNVMFSGTNDSSIIINADWYVGEEDLFVVDLAGAQWYYNNEPYDSDNKLIYKAGEAKVFTLVGANVDMNLINLVYYKLVDGEMQKLDGAPIDAGTYMVTVELKESDKYKLQNAPSQAFVIERAVITNLPSAALTEPAEVDGEEGFWQVAYDIDSLNEYTLIPGSDETEGKLYLVGYDNTNGETKSNIAGNHTAIIKFTVYDKNYTFKNVTPADENCSISSDGEEYYIRIEWTIEGDKDEALDLTGAKWYYGNSVYDGTPFTYDGSAKALKLGGIDKEKLELLTYQYFDGENWTSDAPINAGTYTVKVFGPNNREIIGIEVTKEFTINKKVLTPSAEFEVSRNGNSWGIKVTPSSEDYYTSEVSGQQEVTAPGNYTVTVKFVLLAEYRINYTFGEGSINNGTEFIITHNWTAAKPESQVFEDKKTGIKVVDEDAVVDKDKFDIKVEEQKNFNIKDYDDLLEEKYPDYKAKLGAAYDICFADSNGKEDHTITGRFQVILPIPEALWDYPIERLAVIHIKGDDTVEFVEDVERVDNNMVFYVDGFSVYVVIGLDPLPAPVGDWWLIVLLVILALLIIFAIIILLSKDKEPTEEPVEEPVIEEPVEEEPIIVAPVVTEEEDDEKDGEDEFYDDYDKRDLEDNDELSPIIIPPILTEEIERTIYNRSFIARLSQADDVAKENYNEIKNYILSYKKVRSIISWRYDSFYKGRIKLQFKGKSLMMYIALDPDQLDEKYHVQNVKDMTRYESVPARLKIKSERSLKYAKELVDMLMKDNNVALNPLATRADYTLPYKSTEDLIAEGKIKVKKTHVRQFWETAPEQTETASEQPESENKN